MIHDVETCASEACGAGDRCDDCFGHGTDPDRPDETCMSCGGSGGESPMLPAYSEERRGVRPGASMPGGGS